MKRNALVVGFMLLVAFLVACSGDEVKDASDLESSDQEKVEKEKASSDDTQNSEDTKGESSDQKSDASTSSDQTKTDEGSSKDGKSSNGSNGSKSSSSDGKDTTASTPAEDKGVNGTPRSEEEKKNAKTYSFAEVKGKAVNVIQGVAAAEIKVGNIPEASSSANIYMVADGQTVDLKYDKERDAFRNIQIKGIDVAKLQKAKVYVTS